MNQFDVSSRTWSEAYRQSPGTGHPDIPGDSHYPAGEQGENSEPTLGDLADRDQAD